MASLARNAWKIELIPWDPRSPQHVARMQEQRKACGWLADEVANWAAMERIFYWLIICDAVTSRDQCIATHITKYPTETTPLHDTCSSVRKQPRKPINRSFTPIGHIALDVHTPEEDEKIGLSRSGVVWIKQLYVSHVLQGGGFGAGAMWHGEELAKSLLGAQLIALDTLSKENQMNEEFLEGNYDARGLARPTVPNQDWYVGLGYEIFGRRELGYKYELPGGGIMELQRVYFKKIVA